MPQTTIHEPIYRMSEPEARAFVASRKPGDELRVLFTCRSSRRARVTRINRSGRPVIETFIAKKGVWGSEQPLGLQHILTLDQRAGGCR